MRMMQNSVMRVARRLRLSILIMRILTKEYLEKLKKSEAYQMIVNTPPPDLTKARKDAEIFARWIAREHRKERLAMESRGA